MTDFIFRISPNILLGPHIASRISQPVSEQGKKFMIIGDPAMKDQGYIDKLVENLESKSVESFVFDEIPAAATSEALEQALNLARGAHVDGIISLGGIKASSLGRAIAALYNETNSLFDYLDGLAPKSKPIPYFSVMATCRDPFLFTEYTPVVDARNRQVKLLKIPAGLCKIVFMDPNLFNGLAKNTSLSILLDTISIAIEGYISTKSNFFSDTILEKSIELLMTAIDATINPTAAVSPSLIAAQGGIMACLGAAISSPGMGTALALTINARYKISRSLVSTIMLPYLMEDAIHSRVEKFEKLSYLMKTRMDGMDTSDAAASVVEGIRSRLAQANMPTRLKDLNLTIDQLVPCAEDTGTLEMMNYVPRALSSDDLFDLIKQAY